MTSFKRDEIHNIGRNSNLSQESTQDLLNNHVYSSPEKWRNFALQFTLFTGIGFMAAGIIFFFAYNWDDLHKFAKIGLLEFALLTTFCCSFLFKKNKDVQNGLLLLCTVLVGVLYAVFGQVYQTGANAYDFFFGWTISVALWALIANFPPLQLILVALIQTTLFFYSEQVTDWEKNTVYLCLGAVSSIAIALNIVVQKINIKHLFPSWYENTLLVLSLFFMSSGAIYTILETTDNRISVSVTMLFAYLVATIYGLISKNVFYIGCILLSVIIIYSSYFVRHYNEEVHLLLLSLFIITSVMLSIKLLIRLQKKWSDGEE